MKQQLVVISECFYYWTGLRWNYQMKYQALTLPCPLWIWNPISVTICSIFSNRCLGEWLDVNLIFLSETSYKSQSAEAFLSGLLSYTLVNSVISRQQVTSFSKKPERSREEDMPMSWNALIWVGVVPFSSDSLCLQNIRGIKSVSQPSKVAWRIKLVLPRSIRKFIRCLPF